MAKRAKWRTLPGDPQTRLGWILTEWSAWRDNLLMRLSLLSVALGLWLLLRQEFVLAALGFALFGTASHFIVEGNNEGPALDDPPPERTLTGEVTVLRNGVRLGTDQVVVTFVEGWLHVEGRRVAFSLKRNDVVEFVQTRYPDILRLREGIELHFSVAPYLSREERERYKDACVNFAPTSSYFDHWHKGEIPSGESIFPPNGLHLSTFARPGANLAMGTIGLMITFAVFGLYGPMKGIVSLVFLPGPLQLRAIREFSALSKVASVR